MYRGKNRVIWIMLGALLLLAAAFGAVIMGLQARTERQHKEDYGSLLSSGDKYMEEMDYEHAEAAYLAAIDIDPKNVEPYMNLSDLYYQQGRYEDAAEILRQAEEIVPQETAKTEPEETEKTKKKLKKRIEKYENLVTPTPAVASAPVVEPTDYPTGVPNVEPTDAPQVQPAAETPVPEAGENYTWALQPTVEADDIYYCAEADDTAYVKNERNRQHMSPYAVIRRGASYGAIDMTGTLAGEVNYTGADRFLTSYRFTTSQQKSYQLSDDGKLQELTGIGDYAAKGMFYYCGELQYLAVGMGSAPETAPQSAFPVKRSDLVFQDTDIEGWYQFLASSGKYALYKGNALVTDFVYDECGSLSEGLLAVCQNGRWGYVNNAGKVVIPVEYDASCDLAVGSDASGNPVTRKYCYAASGGYVPLCKGNQWELRDTAGNVVIEAGVFEAIRPVKDGKCWVKKDGKWGVIQVGAAPAAVQTAIQGTAQ